MIPDHTSARIKDVNDERVRVAAQHRQVAPGDIRRLQHDSTERLVLVLSIDAITETAQFTLLHGYTEFATEFDLIVTPAMSGLSYDIVVETDLRGVVVLPAIGEYVSKIPVRVLAACFENSTAFTEDDSAFWGPPLLGPLDARWDFKIGEGDAIRELSAVAIDVLTGENVFWQFDFDEIFNALLEPAEDAGEMALAMHKLWIDRGDRLAITPVHILLFYDRGMLDPELWKSKLGDIGEHFFYAILVPLIDKARSRHKMDSTESQYVVGVDELRELQAA